jgi:hypothetical protein
VSLSRDVIERLPHVEGVLNYLAPMADKPMNLAYDPPPGVARSTGTPEPHRMTIYDARPVAGSLSLDGEGLAIVEHRSAVKDFYDEDELRRVYYPEAERLVAEVTGAARVRVFDHTIRRRVLGGVDRSPGTPRQPVTSVHNDYTVKSGPQRVRDLMEDEADELLRHRFEIVNVWRPIRGPLRDAPLAVCDATSVAFTDFVSSDLVYRDRTGETYRVRYNPAHRWFYVPEMRVDEAILIKCYDSAQDKARFTAHSAFEDPTAPKDVLPRESIELRTLAFHAGRGRGSATRSASTGPTSRRLGSIAAVGVAAPPFEGEAEMLAERLDRVGVVDIWVGVRDPDDDRPEAPVVLPARREHRGDQRVAFVIAQGQEQRHLALNMRFEPDLLLKAHLG